MSLSLNCLYLNHSSMVGGGAERSLIELLQTLRGVNATVVLPPGGDLIEEFGRLNVPVITAPLQAVSRSKNLFYQACFLLSLFRVRRQLRQVVRDGNYDIIHANSTSAALYAVWALGGRDVMQTAGLGHEISDKRNEKAIPLLWHCRDSVELGWVGRWLGQRVSAAIAISDRVGQHLKNYVSPDRIHIIQNGVDAARLRQGKSRNDVRRELRIPQDVSVIGMAAHLIPWKNHALFLKTCAFTAKKFSKAHFVIAGGEPNRTIPGYRESLETVSKELGISQQTHFPGNYPDMGGFYRAIDILCHPVENEPFGRVAAEAMMLGLPVVTVKESGPAEFIEDKITGRIAEEVSVKSIAQILEQLLTHPDQQKLLGQNAATFAHTHLSIHSTADNIVDLYQQFNR